MVGLGGLAVGWAWLLAWVFSSPVWIFLVTIFGMPTDLIDLIKYGFLHGFIASFLAIGMITILKLQASKKSTQ